MIFISSTQEETYHPPWLTPIGGKDRVGNVLIFEKNDRFVKKTSRKIGKRNDRF